MDTEKIEALKQILEVLRNDETAWVETQVHNSSGKDFESLDMELTEDDIEFLIANL